MEFFLLLQVLSTLASLAGASPVSVVNADSWEIAARSPDHELSLRQDVQLPQWCVVGGAVIAMINQAPPDYQGIAWRTAGSGVGTGVTAWGFCKSFAGGTFQEKCTYMGVGVGGLFGSVTSGFLIHHELTSTGEQSADASGQSTKRHELITGSLENRLRQRGVTFDAVNVMSLTARNDNEERDNISFEILGLRGGDGVVSDHLVHMRSNGQGVAKATFPSPLARRGLAKRHQGPGFKFSYDFPKVWSGSIPEEGPMSILADSFGKDWENRMNKDGEFTKAYFGKAKLTNSYTMGFRVSQYDGDFVDTYEDVHECGRITP